MKEKLHIVEYPYQVTRTNREIANGHRAACLWFTGLSGSGKSLLANRVDMELFSRGIKTYVLDGDSVRKGLSKELTFTEEDRIENLRRIGEVVKLMCDAGVVVLAAFITPFEGVRQSLRASLGEFFF